MNFKWQGYILIIAFLFNIGANLSTQGILYILSQHSVSNGLALEQNPIGKILLQTPLLSLIAGIVFYAIIWFKVYTPMIKAVKKKPTKENVFGLNSFVLILFFLLALDFANDFGYLLKLW